MTKSKSKRACYQRKVLKAPKPSAKKEAFLEAFALCGVIGTAAKLSGCHRDSHNVWMVNDPDYPQRFADARENYVDRLVAEATRRACDGTARMRFHNGKPICDPKTKRPYVDREYSDSLLMFLIKKERPEYREASTLHLDGRVQVPVALVDLTDAQLSLIAVRALENQSNVIDAAAAVATASSASDSQVAEVNSEAGSE